MRVGGVHEGNQKKTSTAIHSIVTNTAIPPTGTIKTVNIILFAATRNFISLP